MQPFNLHQQAAVKQAIFKSQVYLQVRPIENWTHTKTCDWKCKKNERNQTQVLQAKDRLKQKIQLRNLESGTIAFFQSQWWRWPPYPSCDALRGRDIRSVWSGVVLFFILDLNTLMITMVSAENNCFEIFRVNSANTSREKKKKNLNKGLVFLVADLVA